MAKGHTIRTGKGTTRRVLGNPAPSYASLGVSGRWKPKPSRSRYRRSLRKKSR